ncbi:LysR substrate-binding domain-containing protein [Dongshaea marina]|uniref:LysR substrate-binding domain-containing protein n=1 Tax=Dongshaea marina TaxID=2047966 RepID=UPI000D3E23D9|nr:LysR substrate-binding domain-containing protein [Dongshaea marina]
MKYLPPLKTLPVFLSVCRHLNFTKAARELCITHSAVSQNIQNLESYLGKCLLQRTTRQMHLTAEGERYRQAIEEGMRLIEQATERELRSQRQVALNAMPTLALKWLIPRLPELTALYPDIDLRLSTHSTLGVDLQRDNLDLAISYGERDNWPDYVVYPWSEDHLVLVGQPAKYRDTLDLRGALAQQNTIWVKDPFRAKDWELWCQSMGVALPETKVRNYFQNSVQAIQAAIAGIGVLVTHRIFVLDELKAGLLVELCPETLLSSSSYYLLCRKERVRHPGVRQVIEWLLQQTASGINEPDPPAA